MCLQRLREISHNKEQSQFISVLDLMSLSDTRYHTKVEFNTFKMIHISFGYGNGPRSGYMNSGGLVSLTEFQQESFRASQWPLTRVILWLRMNEFTTELETAFRQIGLHGHHFFRLPVDMESLRWRLIRNIETSEIHGPSCSSALQEYKEKMEKELTRLSMLVSDTLRSEELCM